VLDEDAAPPKKGHSLLNFRTMSVVAKRSPISATADHLFYQGTGLSLGLETMSLDLGLCLGTESRSLGLEETSFDNMSEIFYGREEILAKVTRGLLLRTMLTIVYCAVVRAVQKTSLTSTMQSLSLCASSDVAGFDSSSSNL